MSDRKSFSEGDLNASDALPVAGKKELERMRNIPLSHTNATMLDAAMQLQKGSDVNGTSRLKSTFIDPYNLLDFLGSRAKPSRVTWQILRRMALSCKPVSAVIQTRQNQIAAFTQIPRRTGDIGFRITTRVPTKRPTPSDFERMNELTEWFLNMGYDQYNSHFYFGERRRDNFDTFIRKIVRDTLTLDAVCFEVQRNQRGLPHAIWPVDPSTIKYAAEKYKWDPRTGAPMPDHTEYTDGLPVRYVQELYSGQRVALFNEKDLCYAVRNPRTDIDIGGYGLSELEILMETVTQVLFTEQYNAKYFTQNALPQGVLNIAGKYTPEALEAFKRQWIAQVSGVANSWKIPIMAIDEAQGGVSFTPFKESNRNMQYNLWLEYLIQTVCSVFTIDPSEIGFMIKGAGGGPMVEHSGAVRLDFSKDKGLRPLLKFLAHIFNEYVVKEIYPDLFFEWVGIDAMSERDKVELLGKKLQNGVLTVNEARALEDLEPIRANWANAPASATLAQVYMADLNYQREQEKADQAAEQQMSGLGGQPEMPPGQGGGQPPEQGGQPPMLPGGGKDAPKELREPTPGQNGVEMPLPTVAKKETTNGGFQEARENEKKMGARKRERDHIGMNVTKSQDGEEVVEFIIQ